MVGVNGDSVDVQRVDNGDVEPVDGEFVYHLMPFWDVYDADAKEEG